MHHIGYRTFGTLNAAKDNAILVCPGASGLKNWIEPYLGEQGALDPGRDFVISADTIGGGDSSKPSDGLGKAFPAYDVRDIVRAHHRLVTEQLGLTSLKAVGGTSMGTLIALQWAVEWPDMVRGLFLWTPGARVTGVGRIVAEKLIASVRENPAMDEAIKRTLPYFVGAGLLDSLPPDQRAFIEAAITKSWASWDIDDFVSRYRALLDSDLFAWTDGALPSLVRCPVLYMPCPGDQVTPIEDAKLIADGSPSSVWRPIQSDWGHLAPLRPPGSPEYDFVARETRQFLRELDR